MAGVVVLVSACLLALASIAAANGMAECPTAIDGVKPYVWYQTVVNCVEETRNPLSDCRWSAGFGSRIDEKVYGGRIIAYKLQWFNGAWSGWFVPGMNDLDCKFNTAARTCSIPYVANSIRKAWAYFYDHVHSVIICR